MQEIEDIKAGYIRVSDVLSIFTKYHTIPKYILNAAAERGSRVHSIIEDDLTDKFAIVSDELIGYYNAFRSWKKDKSLEILSMEHRLYCNDSGVTGKFDLLCKINGEVTLVDWKTSSVPMLPIWKLQLSWYNAMLSKSKLPQAKTLCVVHLSKEGTYEMYRWQFDWKDYDICLKTLELYKFLKTNE